MSRATPQPSQPDPNWQFPDLGRELAQLGIAALVVAVLVGAGATVLICRLVHRSKH